jgi:hypothetical protein
MRLAAILDTAIRLHRLNHGIPWWRCLHLAWKTERMK